MEKCFWSLNYGGGPLIGLALHAGHRVRRALRGHLALNSAARRLEEDPYTGDWAQVVSTSVVVHRSRVECDLNRRRGKSVYLQPEGAWGLNVWQQPLHADVVAESYRLYDLFYQHMRFLLSDLLERHPKLVVLDIHSYNHF